MRGRVLGLVVPVALCACSEPGEAGLGLAEAGAPDGTVSDAGTDAGESLDALCEQWCERLKSTCGAPAGESDEESCDGRCKAQLETLRGTCPQSFREYFTCLLAGRDWSCAGPGVARPTGCEDLAEAWQTCSR